ncbi:DUF916 and DUF3324 domain-containing protein [Agrilactobacillus yilanensis]|uniref:DUF916 and DUF3324 domain-containing protein n=1 Tax=Agrilactobacillus yilanensis TaxID=2485997 RepID=A0ABW4J639_9LACO|nr:DUF916 and DUF3324 domain-containing protein [Agrilactobacillus yilanensis]
MRKMNMARCLGILLFSVMSLWLGMSQQTHRVQAVQVGNIPVDVKAVFPENQNGMVTGYFDFEIASGQSNNLTLEFTNTADKEQTLTVEPVVGGTTYQGELNYEPTDRKADSSLKLPFTDLTSKKQTVTLAGKETKQVTFPVQIPQTTVNGIVLGSLYVSSEQANKEALKARSKKRMKVINTYALYFGVVLRVNDWESAKPDFRLNRVVPKLINNDPGVGVDLQNFEPAMIKDKALSIKARVTQKGSTKTIKHYNMKASFAPNSTLSYPITWGGDRITAGNYTVHMDLKTSDKTWHLKRNFTITGEQAEKLNQANQPKKNYMWLWILIGILAILLIIIFVIYMYKRGRQTGRQSVQNQPQNRGSRKKKH